MTRLSQVVLSSLLPLLVTSRAAPLSMTRTGVTDNNDDYQSKIQSALDFYMANIDSVSRSAYRQGKSDDLQGEVSIQADGQTEMTLEREELQWTEFALEAVDEELRKLNVIHHRLSGLSRDLFSNDFDLDIENDDIMEEQNEDADVVQERWTKDSLDPDKWYLFSYWELHAYFSCAAEFKKLKQVYTPERWNDLRQFYHEFVQRDLEDWPLKEGARPRSYPWTDAHYDPPMEPFQSGYKGRGLKASRDIREGELLFQATNNTIIFTHGHTWRKFLFEIYERHGEEEDQLDSETACDVLVWSWVQQLVPDGPLIIVMDMDNGSLMNEGRDEEGWEIPNIKCGKNDWCDFEYYALKDIKKGEEILCDYREFAMIHSWPKMGL